MTQRRRGTTATQRPARYAKLLGGHWAEKGGVEVAAGVILIRFDSARWFLGHQGSRRWSIEVAAPDGVDADRIATVVAEPGALRSSGPTGGRVAGHLARLTRALTQ